MSDRKRFLNKVVIVTGAAQGIGRGVALQAAAEGAQVVLVDRSEYVSEVLAEIQAAGGEAITVNADLEGLAGAQAVVDKTIAVYGRIDALINNVGVAIWMKPFTEFSEEQIIKEVGRSLFPTLWCCRAVLPEMIKSQKGTIVNVSSVATCGINRAPYSASKGGVNALTSSLALAHAKDGIRVNAVATGGTEAPPRKVARNDSPMSEEENKWVQEVVEQTIEHTYFGRYGSIQEQVNGILFLASDESSYITGTILPVVCGDQG